MAGGCECGGEGCGGERWSGHDLIVWWDGGRMARVVFDRVGCDGTGGAGEDLSMEESLEVTPARKRGRPRKSEGGQGMVKADEGEVSPSGGSGKRKMVEAVLDADNLKRPCHGKNGRWGWWWG